MRVIDLIRHLGRVEETVGNVLVLVGEHGDSLDELNRLSLVKVQLGAEDDAYGDYELIPDDCALGRQAVWLCHASPR